MKLQDKQVLRSKANFFAVPMTFLSKIPEFVSIGGVPAEDRISVDASWAMARLYQVLHQQGTGNKVVLNPQQVEEVGQSCITDLDETQVRFNFNRFVINKGYYDQPETRQELFESSLISVQKAEDGNLIVTVNLTEGAMPGQNYFVKISSEIFRLRQGLSVLETLMLFWFFWYYRLHYKDFYRMEITIGVEPFLKMKYFNGLLTSNPDALYQLRLAVEKFTKRGVLLKGLLGPEDIFFKLSPQYFFCLDYLKRRGRAY